MSTPLAAYCKHGNSYCILCFAESKEGVAAPLEPTPLVIEIARELYDRFVMGRWEPEDAYPQIKSWLAAVSKNLQEATTKAERERDAAIVTLRAMCGDEHWQTMGRTFEESLAKIEAREALILELESEITALRETK